MAEWRWHTGEVSGKCPHCDNPLFPGRLLADFRSSAESAWRVYHIECLVTFSIGFVPIIYPGWMPA